MSLNTELLQIFADSEMSSTKGGFVNIIKGTDKKRWRYLVHTYDLKPSLKLVVLLTPISFCINFH